MTNNDKKLALDWANTVLADLGHYSNAEHAAARRIIATTPALTMDELEWKDSEHTLAGATLDIGNGPQNVTMAARIGTSIFYITEDGEPDYKHARFFTPNGKHYELHEAGAADVATPKTLATEQDYENAPEGTIVALPGLGSVPLLKRDGKWHRDRLAFGSKELADDSPVAVLRDGWNG